jgi:tetratricopeptide (TPR) repeat protein
MRYTLIILLLLFFRVNSLTAQVLPDEQVAMQYYKNEEYDKALLAFEELFKDNPASKFYYSYYLKCLIALEDYREAEKMLKKLQRKYPNETLFMIDMRYVYGLMQEEKKKSNQYDKVLKELKADEGLILNTANAFLIVGAKEYAIKTYEKGRDLLNDEYVFAFALADLYAASGDIQNAMRQYLIILDHDPGKQNIVQDKLQDLAHEEGNYQTIREILVRDIQTGDYRVTSINLLSWLFVQHKDFRSAFVQLRSLDKRFENMEPRLISLADICISNEDYDVAVMIYEYIENKNPLSPYYNHARLGLLNLRYLKLKYSQQMNREELLSLERDYELFLQKEFHRYTQIAEGLILKLAALKALYLNKIDEAIGLLERYILFPGLSKTLIAEMKMALGDYYILAGDVWEAELLYSQADKMFRDHPLGHEARFRKAKLAFYKGDFDYAEALLEVLKGSTSELIANDALQLSLLIRDNTGLDTTEIPLQMFARADFLSYKQDYEAAILVLDSIILLFSGHSLTDDIYLLKAQIAEKQKDFQRALHYYEKIFTEYPYDLLADDALFHAAELHERFFHDEEQASLLYEKLLLEYKDSVFVIEARKRYRKIRGV